MGNNRSHVVQLDASDAGRAGELWEWLQKNDWIDDKGELSMQRRHLLLNSDDYDVLTLTTQWHVAHAFENYHSPACPACGERFPETEYLVDHIDQWWETQTPPDLSCWECGHTRPIDQWDLTDAFAAGHLAINNEWAAGFERTLRDELESDFGGRWVAICAYV